MSADTTDRASLDDPLMQQLRDTLDQVDAAEATRPSLTPPWQRIQQGMDKARRKRRRTRAVRIGAGVLALSTLGAGTVTGFLHYPSFVPIEAVPGIGGRSALDDGRTRGALGSDTAWLRALREHVAAADAEEESGGESWHPPAAQDLSVLFAGDVGEHRIALVEGSWHWGPIGDRQQVWYTGPAGASAQELTRGGNNHAQDEVAGIFGPEIGDYRSGSWSGSGPRTSAIVVLGAGTARVELEESPVISAAARVEPQVRRVSSTDGVYQGAITMPGTLTLRVNGDLIDRVSRTTTLAPNRSGALTPARGGAAETEKFDPADLGDELRFAAGQGTSGGGDYQLLAAEPQYRDVGALSVRALVGRVTLPSGARVVGVGQVTDRNMSPGGVVDEDVPHMSQLDNAWLLPAGGDEGLALAWRQPAQAAKADQLADSGTTPALSGWTAAMGPKGTVSVEWVDDAGAVTTTAALNTLATIDREDVSSVRFLAADGRRLATTRVRGPHAPADPGGNGWVIPEVQKVLLPGW